MKNRDVRACCSAARGWCLYSTFSCAQPVTYQSLAREAGLPYDLAKALLFEFFTQHKAVRCVAPADMRARVHVFASRLSATNGWPSACSSSRKLVTLKAAVLIASVRRSCMPPFCCLAGQRMATRLVTASPWSEGMSWRAQRPCSIPSRACTCILLVPRPTR